VINSLWSLGGLSDSLSGAGVAVRLFDYSSDKDMPWLNCDKASCYDPPQCLRSPVGMHACDEQSAW
jgi:hypothetical protein